MAVGEVDDVCPPRLRCLGSTVWSGCAYPRPSCVPHPEMILVTKLRDLRRFKALASSVPLPDMSYLSIRPINFSPKREREKKNQKKKSTSAHTWPFNHCLECRIQWRATSTITQSLHHKLKRGPTIRLGMPSLLVREQEGITSDSLRCSVRLLGALAQGKHHVVVHHLRDVSVLRCLAIDRRLASTPTTGGKHQRQGESRYVGEVHDVSDLPILLRVCRSPDPCSHVPAPITSHTC